MRVVLPVLLLAAMALSGCADYPELDGFVAPPDAGDANATASPATVEVNATAAPSPFPAVNVATADYTAPVAMELDRFEGEAAILSLVADANGLRCVSVPLEDPMASPAGYRAVSSWARCSLSANGSVFTSGASGSMAADIPLMQGIPVEAFTWNMTIGRSLLNNTGEHEQVLDSVERAETAAPSVSPWASLRSHHFTSPYTVCDTFLQHGLATIRIESMAHNGRARLQVDVSDHEVWDVQTSAAPVDAANATMQGTESIWWDANGTLTALGAWEHASSVRLDITIRFEGRGTEVGLLAPPECAGATFVDYQALPYEARAIGIAAGWMDRVGLDVHVAVWHSL